MISAPAPLEFAFATPADEADLRRLLRENPMRGALDVSFTREPNYFLSTGLGRADDLTLIARENDRLVAAGRCTTRPCWLNGEVRSVAYLGELRLDASVQGRWDILRHGYTHFSSAYASNPADFCFTSIIADNSRARRLLERGVRGMPRYQFIGEYVSLLIPTAKSPVPAGYTVATGADIGADRLADFLNAAAKSRHLAACWSPPMLRSLADRGLRPADFVLLRQNDKIIACAGIWNQQSYRQVRIQGYNALLTATRPLYNLLSPLLRQPSLPPVGTVLNQAFLTPFACHPDHVKARPQLLQAARSFAAQRGLDCLALGGTPSDPWLSGLPGRRYLSRLYRIDWAGAPRGLSALDARPYLPDIGLL